MAGTLEFGILGPLEVSLRGESVRVGGPKQRALLALLLLSANRVVSRDRLIAELFGEETATPADTALRVRVSRLRGALRSGEQEARLVAKPPGYVLRVEPDELDLIRFERLLARGRESLAANDARNAAALLGDALSLWRGRPLADLEFEPFVRIEIERLEELRLSTIEDWIDAELAVGRHAQLVAELEALTADHPLRERLRSQLMLALYRSGRQAEGLEIYRRTRTLLQEELGLEPGTALRELQRAMLAQEPALEFQPPPSDGAVRAAGDACPFKGLAAYERDDRSLFFGRERVVDELLAMAADTQFIAVIGASGAGKSSLLRAGLLPALSDDWRDVVVRPGPDPPTTLHRALGGDLGSALASLRRGHRLVIAVDQFEEVFTSCADEGARKEFIDDLVNAAWDPERRALVAIALRADFFGRLAPYPELAQLIGASHVLLGPMNERELARVVEGPCEQVGLSVEPALVAALVRGVAGEPGGLPLLSSALVELWQKRTDGAITFESYEQTAGVSGAVARLAERAWARLDADDRVLGRAILLRMVAGGGNEPAVPRSISVDELEPRQLDVVDVLTDARLLTRSDDTAEIAHEALLTHWPRLRDWLEEDVQGRAIHAHLVQAAGDWENGGKEPSELYRGTRLAAALAWVESHDDELNAGERAFVEESRRAEVQDLERERRRNRRLRRQRALALALAAVAVAAGAWALVKRHDAQAAATSADAERLGAQALVEPSLDRSLLLARAGVALDDSLPTRAYLLAALLRSPAAIGVMRGSGARFRDEALSPDGRTLAVRGDDGATWFFDTTMHRPVGVPTPGSSQIAGFGNISGPLRAVAYSPDGRTIAVGGTDGSHGALQLADAHTHRQRMIDYSPNTEAITDVAFSRDGRKLATGEDVSGNENPAREVIVLRDARTGFDERDSAPIRAGRLAGFALEGRRLLVTRGGAAALLLDTATLRRVRTLPATTAAAISPDGAHAALARPDGSVVIADLRTGASRTLRGHLSGAATTVAFAPGGALLATGSADGSIAFWTVHGGLRETLIAHSGAVQGVTFSPDDRTLYSVAKDWTAIASDASGDRRLARLIRIARKPVVAPSGLIASALSPDGSRVAASPGHDRIELVSSQTGRLMGVLRGPFGDAYELRFSPDGKLLAASGTHSLVVWAVATHRVTQRSPSAGAVAFSPDGSTLAAAGGSGGVTLYDLRTGEAKVTLPTGAASIDSVDYSRDGKLVAAGLDGVATVWDLPGLRPVARLAGPGFDFVARFAPNGKQVAVGGSTGAVVLWDIATRKRVGPLLAGHNGGVLGIAFSGDGKLLVTASGDGKLRLWDVAQHKLIGEPLSGTSNGGPVEFWPDGKHVFGMWGPGIGVDWDVDPSDWAARACLVANRTLTRAEWKQFVPDVGYRRICPA